ncbi:hypothetical protein U1Q18_041182 [Sarracenia purpurea var. burkii]
MLPTDASLTGAVSGDEREIREREQRWCSSSPPSPAFFFAGGCRLLFEVVEASGVEEAKSEKSLGRRGWSPFRV